MSKLTEEPTGHEEAHGGPWELYGRLIDGVPAGPCVVDYCLGTHWSYVRAECGMGVAFTTSGGGTRKLLDDMRGVPLREMARLSKSWCFEEASLGIAALNAWYCRPQLLDALGAAYDDDDAVKAHDAAGVGPVGPRSGLRMDAFDRYRPQVEAIGDAKVVVVGHFPRVERIADYAHLTVLERKCGSDWDTPDPACEYVLPGADFAFITGVTLINKTAPRLLQLASAATTVMVGPSVVMSPELFAYGVDSLSGSVVSDPERAEFAVKNGVGKFFGRALRMCELRR